MLDKQSVNVVVADKDKIQQVQQQLVALGFEVTLVIPGGIITGKCKAEIKPNLEQIDGVLFVEDDAPYVYG